MQLYEYLAKVVNFQFYHGTAPSISDGPDFDTIIDVASRNHIMYMVCSTLLQEKNLTDKQIETLRSNVKFSVFRSLIQDSELKRMINTFEKAGVKNIPLKGSVIRYLYPRPELREMSDIDVLIDLDDIEEAKNSLNNIGFELKSSIKHHDIYCKNNQVTIEAHKSMYDKTVDNAQYQYFVGFDKCIIRNNCKYTYDLQTEDFYVYMIAHAAKHFYAMGCGIRNLIDIYVYLKKYKDTMDMSYVRSELARCGIADFACHMEKLAFDWIEGKELDGFYLSLFEYMIDAGIYGKDENGIWNKFADAQKDNISKWELKAWYYFPPYYYMSEYYPWIEEHHFLLPVAWLIRFMRGIFLHKGAKKREMVKSIKSDQIMTYKVIYQKMNLKFSSKSK